MKTKQLQIKGKYLCVKIADARHNEARHEAITQRARLWQVVGASLRYFFKNTNRETRTSLIHNEQ